MTPEQIAELEALVAKATPGPWEVYEQTIAASTPERRADNAKAEMLLQVQMTTEMVDHIYLLSAGDKCPATTGCGPTSATNADLIVTLVNNLPAILAALKAQQPDEAMVARALAPHMEGGREFDQMPPDRMALRKWSREGMCNTNDATQDDALEAARAAIAAMQESRDETRRHSHRRPSEGGKNNLAQ
jgi:hypothetical protein